MALVFAYLDPDSGSMLLQMIAGGVAGAGVLLRYQWRVACAAVRGRFTAPVSVPAGNQQVEVESEAS